MTRFAGRSSALFRRGLVAGALLCGLGASTASAATCPNDAHRTGPSAALPDCRAYELVSPALKAHSVMANSARFRISEQGSPGLPMAAVFQSLGSFSDPEGTGVAVDYLAQRTLAPGTQGWTTQPLTPLQDPLSFAAILNGYDPFFVGEGTPDLTRMLFRTVTDMTTAPNLATLLKLYLRTDLRTPGHGTYELLNDPGFSVPPFSQPSADAQMHVAGTSTDLRRVLIESRVKLTADAPASTASPKVYKSVDGVVQLVSVLPAEEGGRPAPSAITGQSAGTLIGPSLTPNVISDDGSRAFFTVPTDQYRGRLYMRDDQGTSDVGDDVTVRIDRSERTVPEPEFSAGYWNAAVDGSRVFFTTTAALTDDASTVNVDKLYVYDTTKPPSAPDNLTYISDDQEPADGYHQVLGAIDASADGSTVYFVQMGQIVAGQPTLDSDLGIYGWREGRGVQFVGRLQDYIADPISLLPRIGHGLDNEWGASVTPDGRHLLLSVRQEPWPGNNDLGDCGGPGQPINGKVGCRQLYLYDFETGEEPVCVSCRPSGEASTAPASFFVRVGAGGSIPGTHRNRPLSEDGRYVYFTTAERLIAADLNDRPDVYRYDAPARALELISAGDRPEGAYFVEASADGQDVFIATRAQLSPWDIDGEMDIYDARVDGGVAAPPPVAQPCSGDACQGDRGTAPGDVTAGTSLFSAPPTRGKVTKPKPRARRRARQRACRGNRVRRRVDGRIRCVTRARARRLARRGGAR